MNVGVHVCVILNDVFSQYRPGIGVKILGLTLLKFFVLACGGCPLKGLFPVSIPTEACRDNPSYPGSLSHELFADQIAFLSDGI